VAGLAGNFSLPVAMRPALEVIADLPDDAVDELRSVLERHPEVLFSRQAAMKQAATLRKVPRDQAESLMETTVPLVYFKGAHGKSTAELIADVNALLGRAGKGKAALTADQQGRLEKNLSRLLDSSSLTQAAKAIAVATDCPRLFTEARVISDLRPVFGDRTSEPPVGAVVTHTLRVTYAEEGSEKEFFVYLDSGDLKTLQDHIARALEKDTTLRALLAKINLKTYETS